MSARSAALADILLLSCAVRSHMICLDCLFVLIHYLLPVFVLSEILVKRPGVTLLNCQKSKPNYSVCDCELA